MKQSIIVIFLILINISFSTQAETLQEYRYNSLELLKKLSNKIQDNQRNISIIELNLINLAQKQIFLTNSLEQWLKENPNDLYAKIYYGYTLIFNAGYYLSNKNYMQAAELAKQGFFYIDEAAESQDKNWRLRYLRARLDSFVPKNGGRCVVAVKDLKYLRQSSDVPEEMQAIIAYLYIHALINCERYEEAEQLRKVLPNLAGHAKLLAQLNDETPFITEEEVNYVIRPIVEGTQL